MTNKKLTPCLLPWLSIGSNSYSSPRICGYSKLKGPLKLSHSSIQDAFNSDVYKQTRIDFLNGKWPDNCQKCQYMENQFSDLNKKKLADKIHAKHKNIILNTASDGSVNHFPKHLAINMGSICNLRCIHCSPSNSTSWLQDEILLNRFENTIVPVSDTKFMAKENHIWKEIRDNFDKIERLDFLGGEPFAFQTHNNFIKDFCNHANAKNIVLNYVSNGTLIDETVLDSLKKFNKVNLSISLDATHDPLEFYRFPLLYTDFVNNLNYLIDSKSDSIDLVFNWTGSNITIFYLENTLREIEKKFPQVPIRLSDFVFFPSVLSSTNLPKNIKLKISEGLKLFLKKVPNIEMHINHMNSKETSSDQLKNLILYLDALSLSRQIDWKKSFHSFAIDIMPHLN
jgi:MoaA/NifB/PqqE/SkfB family radical SAM enzyme